MEKKGCYLVIDFETTGLNPMTAGIIEVAAMALDEHFNVLESFATDICPPEECDIDPEAMVITGFTMERIRSGKSYTLVSDELLAFIEGNFSQKPILIGQFLPFDFACLCKLFREKCKANRKLFYDQIGNNFIDTKSLVNFANMLARLRGKELPFTCTSLSAVWGLRDMLGCNIGYRAHTALGDVMATRDVLMALSDTLPEVLQTLKK